MTFGALKIDEMLYFIYCFIGESMKDEVVEKKKIEPVFGMFGIEPVVILINLGRCMIGVQISNLYIEKTCKVCNILQ